MVDRQKMLVDFVTAWAEYERRMTDVGSVSRKAVAHDPDLQQMVLRITDELARSPEVQRDLAMRLALAEFAKAT